VDVAIGANQHRHVDTIAADIFHEIAEDGEAGDDVKAILRAYRRDGRYECQTDEPETSHR
jgi:hypothetical protein